MKKKYDSPRTKVYAVNPSMPLAQSPLSSNGKTLRLNSSIETKDASNAASRSYEFDDD